MERLRAEALGLQQQFPTNPGLQQVLEEIREEIGKEVAEMTGDNPGAAQQEAQEEAVVPREDQAILAGPWQGEATREAIRRAKGVPAPGPEVPAAQANAMAVALRQREARAVVAAATDRVISQGSLDGPL